MEQLLTTKLYIPPTRQELVTRSRLIEKLDDGLNRKLTLVSAPAGFGKTTLVSDWVTNCKRPVAWLSLDKGDCESRRFLGYLVAALQTVSTEFGEGILGMLQSSQPPPIESILTALLNEVATVSDDFVLVLDDFHVIDAKQIDHVITFLLENLPPQMHLANRWVDLFEGLTITLEDNGDTLLTGPVVDQAALQPCAPATQDREARPAHTRAALRGSVTGW